VFELYFGPKAGFLNSGLPPTTHPNLLIE
jgi:hypothetical protein